MAEAALEQRVAAVRRFSRFYTRRIGVLGETMLKSPFSLTEARVLYEIAHTPKATAGALCAELGLDAGYVSRILARFEQEGLISRKPSATDARRSLISITAKGRKTFAPLEKRSQDDAAALLSPLPCARQRRLVEAMRTIETLIEPARAEADAAGITLRAPKPGDMGWIISRHGALYAEERGWNAEFEALVGEIVTEFAKSNDPARERCWIAERDGEPVGCIFAVAESAERAKLRLLLVEPSARGLGLGQRLVAECISFARSAGYREMTLWTQSCLTGARRIYQAAGFKLVHSEPHHSFGHDLVGEHWDLAL
jgi:DNA-binding MarR family transcriptional regulator/GNAT superfamily N-acetyltransferase